MKILYTTSFEDGRAPVNSGGSIGGYASSAEVRNDDFDSLFSGVTLYGVSKNRPEYRAIVLQNNSTEKLLNVRISMETEENSICSFSFAPVAMTQDGEGRWVMERISDIYSKPYYANFINEEVGIGDVEPGVCVGVWIRRTNVEKNVREIYDNVAQRQTLNPYLWEPIKRKSQETSRLIIEWD